MFAVQHKHVECTKRVPATTTTMPEPHQLMSCVMESVIKSFNSVFCFWLLYYTIPRWWFRFASLRPPTICPSIALLASPVLAVWNTATSLYPDSSVSYRNIYTAQCTQLTHTPCHPSKCDSYSWNDFDGWSSMCACERVCVCILSDFWCLNITTNAMVDVVKYTTDDVNNTTRSYRRSVGECADPYRLDAFSPCHLVRFALTK